MGGAAAAAKWAFLAVPLVGVLELGAHFVQVGAVVPDADWAAARVEAAKALRPDDLLAFAPAWTEPLGRHHFGDELATILRMAAPDAERFPRAVEVSIRGKHDPRLAGWRKVAEARAGKVTIATYENPAPAPVLEDLVTRVDAGRAEVTQATGGAEAPCPFGTPGAEAGNIGFGPAIPARRYRCPSGAFAGLTVLPDLTYTARRCVFTPPPGAAGGTHLRFPEVKMGTRLRGHHGVAVHNERDKTGAPVALAIRVNGQALGRFVHNDGDGWKAFEIATPDLAGQTADVVVEVTSTAGQRQYCWEAVTQ